MRKHILLYVALSLPLLVQGQVIQWGGGNFILNIDSSNFLTRTAAAALYTPLTSSVLSSPFTLGSTSVTTTGARLNYLSGATGTTGTTTSNLVFSARPTLTGTTATDTITANYITVAQQVREQYPDHFFAKYASQTGLSVNVTPDSIPVQIGGSALLTDVESDGFSIDAQDTITYSGYAAAHIFFQVSVSLTGTNAKDYGLLVYNQTDAAEVPAEALVTMTGATNTVSCAIIAYDKNAGVGDEYTLKIRGYTDGTDVTILRVMFFARVAHY